MRTAARLLLAVLVTLVGVVPLAVSYTLATAVQLLATTVFILGGTGHPLVVVGPGGSTSLETPYATDYGTKLLKNYIVPSGEVRDDSSNPDDYKLVAVYSPEEFFPVSGLMTFDDSVEAGQKNLNGCVTGGHCVSAPIKDATNPVPTDDKILIVGYSQSAVIASLVKRDLIAAYDPEEPPVDVPVSFVLLANPMRPNGGILARGFEGLTIPLIGIKFYGPAPTDSCKDGGPCYETVDVAQQYDLLGGDAPADLLNVLAWANSLAAYAYLHGEVPEATLDEEAVNLDQAIQQGEPYGDTTYYLIPAERLPLLMPLAQLGVPDPILAVVDAPLRVLIEASYVRDVSPGEQVKFTLLPAADPITVGVNFVRAIPVGIDDGVEMVTGERPLDTVPADHYGVGGDDESTVFENPPVSDGQLGESVVAREADTPAPDVEGLATAQNLKTGTPELKKESDTVPSRLVRERVRGPIGFDDRRKLSTDQPTGNRPERIANGLTGQRPDLTGQRPDRTRGGDRTTGDATSDPGSGNDQGPSRGGLRGRSSATQ